jgi:hypothetical protein
MMKNFLFVFVALALVPSLALAGGGSKANGVINVKNNGSLVMGVIIDPPASLDPATATQAQFTAAGGKFVNAGATGTFTKLKAGNHTVVVFQVPPVMTDALAAPALVISSKTYHLGGSQTLNVVVTFNADGTANFNP